MQNSINSNHSQNGNNFMHEIAFSDPLIKFSVTDSASPQLFNSVSSIDNSANPITELPNEQIKAEKQQNLLINMQFELSEPYLITNIHLVSTYMEFSKANFEFYQAKQNQFSHQRINGIEKNTSNHQFINMIKLEPNQYGFLEKLGLVSDEQGQNKEYQLKVLGIAQALKLQFQITSHTVMDVLVKFQNDHQNYSDSVFDNIKQFLGSDSDDLTHNKLLDIDDALSLFKVCFESIQIFGYKLSCSPPVSHGVALLNLSNVFRKHNRIEEAIETEVLSGLSFMNSRKYVQSSEIFIKAAKFYKSKYLKSISKDMNQVLFKKNKQNCNLIESIQNSQVGKLQLEKSGDLMNYILQRNSLKQHFQLFQSAQSIQPSHQVRTSYSVQGNNFLNQDNALKQNLLENTSYNNTLISQTSNKNLIKSAKMELLAADCIVQPYMLNQKVAAYSRAIDSFTNIVDDQQININHNFDPYSALLKLSPYLTKLCLKCLSDKQENIQIAAVKTLEFMVEQLGCTLGNQLPCILISVFMNYPIIKEEEPTILKQYDLSDSEDNEDQFLLSQNSSRSGSKTDKDDSDKKRNSSNIENEEDLEKEIFFDRDEELASKVNDNNIKNENEGKRMSIVEEERISDMDVEKQKQTAKKNQKEAENDKKQNKKGQNSLQALAEIRKKMEKRQKGNYVSKSSYQQIVDNYHHFLETFINVLASASSQILRIIFQEIISVYILLRELSPDLRIYLFRIAEKILAICQGDVQIDMSFFHYMLYAIDGSGYESFYTESQITNIQYYALKLWETIKLKLVYNMNISQLNGVINWISEMLLALLEAEQEGEKKDLQNILNKVYQLLDLITIITIRYHTNRKNLNPINYLKNDSYYQRQEELNLDKQINEENFSALANLIDNGQDETEVIQEDQIKKTEKFTQEDVEEETNIILKYFKKIKLNHNNNNILNKNNKKLILINQKSQINVDNLIKPLILWVENSLQYQNQIDIFKNIWLVMVEILPEDSSINLFDVAYPLLERVAEHIQMSSPPHLMLEFIKIIISSLPKLKQNAQNENVYFLQQFFIIFCDCIPHSVDDEPFQIFDILLYIIQLHLNPEIIKKCIDTFVDKFTMRGKAQKRSQEFFLRVITSKPNVNSLKYLIDECLITNQEPQFVKLDKNKNVKQNKKVNKDQDLKQFNNEYEIFQEKIILLQEALIYLQYYHFENLKQFFEENILSQAIIKIINSGNSKVRIKATNIAKLILEQYLKGFSSQIQKKNKSLNLGSQLIQASHFLENLIFKIYLGKKNKLYTSKKSINTLNTQEKEIEDPDFYQNIFKTDIIETQYIDQIQILMIKFQLQVTKVTFCQENRDNKLLFNSLIILDLLFQTIFSGPSIQTEITKYIQNKQPELSNIFNAEPNQEQTENDLQKIESQNFQLSPDSNDLDLNNLLIQPNTLFIRTSSEFQELRLNEIIDLVPFVSNLLHSPWSNIRSLTYGLLCYWVKPNIGNYKAVQQKQFLNLILEIIENLLVNQESECRTGGLNIIGSLCGLGYNFDTYTEKMKDILGLFRQCENIIPAKIWKAIYKIQFDWDSTNQAAALALIQLCAPKQKIKKFYLQMNKTSSIVLNLDQKNTNLSRLSMYSQLHQGKEDSFINLSNLFGKQNDKKNIKRAQSVQVQSAHKELHQNNISENTQSQKIAELVMNRNNDDLLILNQDETIQKYQEENAKMGSQNEYKNSVKSANLINNNNNEDEEESQKAFNDDELDGIFWVEYLNSKDIRDYISMFRNEYKPPSTLWIERVNYNNEEDSNQIFQDQQEAIQLSEETDILTVQQRSTAQQKQQSQQINFRQQNNQNHQLGQYIDQDVHFQQKNAIKTFNESNEQDQNAKATKIHRGNINHDLLDDQLEFEQLGIIDAGEEDWNENEENRVLNQHNQDLQFQNKKDKDQTKENIKSNQQTSIMKDDDDEPQQQLLIKERKKFQNQGNANGQYEKSQNQNDYLGSPRNILMQIQQDSSKNQQTFPTDDDELDEEALEAELKNKIEQNFNINSGTNELELMDDQSYQYQPKHQKLVINPQSNTNTKTPANQKRQAYNLPTSNSEEEVINNQVNVNHESKTYLQKLMQTNSDKKNKIMKNLDLLSQTSSQYDDVIRLSENSTSKEESESIKGQIQQSTPSTDLQKEDSQKINDTKETSNNQQKSNESQDKNEKVNNQKQDLNKSDKVFNINSFLMNDKEYIQQKIYQDQKQLLLKQSKMSNLLVNQQQPTDNKNNHINIQQQIIQQQQLLAEAQSKKKQAILIEGESNTNNNNNNKLMQLSDSNSIQDLCFDINHDTSSSQEKVENPNDQLFYISKTQESSDFNEIDQNNKNNYQILDSNETLQSNDSDKQRQLYSKSQQNQEQNINWENVSLRLQHQQQQNKGAKFDQALAFSFQNSNQTSMPQSNHASVLLVQSKKGEELSAFAQQAEQLSSKIFNSFQVPQNQKLTEEDTSPNKLYDGSQFQSAEFERSPDTDREAMLNINLYQNDKNNNYGSSPPIARKLLQDDKSKENLAQSYQNFEYEKQNYEQFLVKDKQKNDLEAFAPQKKNELREYSQESLIQQLANYQKFDKKATLQYTSSSEDQVVILDSNQTLDRPTSKDNKSKIFIDTSGNFSKSSVGGFSSDDRKYQKIQSNVDEVLEESKFAQQNTNGLVPTIKKKSQKREQEGEQYFIREGDSSRYNKKDEGIIEEFLTEEESSTEEQSSVKLKQRYASEPAALQPIYPLSQAQSPSQSLLQKSEEYYGRFQGQAVQNNTPLLSGQSHLISQQSTQQQNYSTANVTGNTTANEINHINSASSKNSKRSINKSKERSNSPKQKKTQKKMQTQLQQTNNQLQQQQQQIYQQQQNLQFSQLQSVSSFQQSQLNSPQQQQQTQYYNSENLTAFQTPLIQKSLTPSNRAKEIAFRRNSNSSQKGLQGQQSNGEIFTSKKRLNMNENVHTHHLHNNYMNNSSNSKHNKTSESGGNGTQGKYYKSIGYKLLTKNHSTNNIFNTSSLINTTQGSTSFNNGSAINLALSQLHNNTSNNQQKGSNICKDKLIKKLMTSKGLDASELKSVLKLHQQTQMFFNHPQNAQYIPIGSTYGESRNKTRLSKSPQQKNFRISSNDSAEKSKKKSKSTSPLNERIEMSPDENKDSYPSSLHISSNYQNSLKNSKFSKDQTYSANKNSNPSENFSMKQLKKGDYQQKSPYSISQQQMQEEDQIYQRYKRNFSNLQINEEKNENSDDTSKATVNDELSNHFSTLSQQGRSNSQGQIHNNSGKKKRKSKSKEQLTITNENGFDINQSKKDKYGLNEKELTVSLASSTKSSNVQIKNKKFQPINISGINPSQVKIQASSSKQQQFEKFLNQGAASGNKQTTQNKRSSSSKKLKELSKSKSKKEVVILQNISQQIQQFNQHINNNTSSGYLSNESISNKQKLKNEILNFTSFNQNKNKKQDLALSSQLKMLQQTSSTQPLPQLSNDSYLVFDTQQQFFKIPSNSQNPNSNYSEFMKNAQQINNNTTQKKNINKEMMDELNQTL